MSRIINVEVLIAWPPTKKCEETVEVLEELVRRYPDELRLLVWKRGIDFCPEEASGTMKHMMHKGNPVPACCVNGMFFSARVVPKLDELVARVEQAMINLGMKSAGAAFVDHPVG